VFLRQLEKGLKPFPKITFRTPENNNSMAHVCGTCRFGTDPKSSALGAQNWAHEVDNPYVVDASFFPSCTGLNPGLTVTANALRVAAQVKPFAFRHLNLLKNAVVASLNRAIRGACHPERSANWANGLAFRPDLRSGMPAARMIASMTVMFSIASSGVVFTGSPHRTAAAKASS
jgi:hypothetical protein